MKKLFITAMLGATCLSAFGQSSSTVFRQQITPKVLHQLDSLFHYLDNAGLYNGNILVASGGKKVAGATLGYSNLMTKERLSESSAFELASVSKQFTAFGILRLVEAGKIRLDQKVESILPGFPYKDVTIRHLLNHTGGLPDYEKMMADNWDKSKIANNSDLQQMFIKPHPDPLFAPGTKWEYSNAGYATLGSVIEKVSGKSFADYMQSKVFKPLHLAHTFVYMRRYAPKNVKGYAYGFVRNDDGTFVLPDSIGDLSFVRYLDGIGGDGSVNSTVGDLLEWDNAVKQQKLLSAALWKEALTPPVIDGKSTGYGFGFEIATSPERGRALVHNGGWPGYITRNVIYLDKDVDLIFLCNQDQSETVIQGTWDAVKNIVFGKPFKFPEPLIQKAVAVDKSIYNKYTGVYVSPELDGFELTITTKNGMIYAQGSGQGTFEIKPESETTFFVPDMPVKMEFKAEGNKSADMLILHQNGDHEFKRKQ